MKILKEGTITIQPDGTLLVEGFHIEGGGLAELHQLALKRLRIAFQNNVLRGNYGNDVTIAQEP